MPTVAQLLSRGMDTQVREIIERRTAFMVSQLNYLNGRQDRHFTNAERAGWTLKRLEVVCWLNSFFQVVVSPLAASATHSSQLDLGGATPILYGSKLRFDTERRTNIESMHRAFFSVCAASGIDPAMLAAHRAEDLVYLISRRISENE
jgi:hypothetical protein